jgi:histidinol-phosphate aminotransferase
MTNTSHLTTLFRPEILAMTAYKVHDASGMIKLDAMENPYNWPQDIEQLWLESLKNCPINRYPDPMAHKLTRLIRQMDNIPDEFAILPGNGSDEIIQILLMALPGNASVLSVVPSFVMYEQISKSLGLNYHAIPLHGDSFDLDLPLMLAEIKEHRPSVIFLSYPNNPTGNLFSETSILKIIEVSTGLIIIDEAYAPFANASFMDRLAQTPKLLVMRTLSKLGLAGIRLGYLAGDAKIIEELNKIRLPYNINILTQLTAQFALSHKAMFDQQTQRICADRTRVNNELKELDGFTIYPSSSNFILFRTPKNRAGAIFEALKQQGILIKNLDPQGGLLADCLRVTIGRTEENTAFINAIKNA